MKHTSNKLVQISTIVLIGLFLASCASSKKSQRKCNGKKGVKTPMGLM